VAHKEPKKQGINPENWIAEYILTYSQSSRESGIEKIKYEGLIEGIKNFEINNCDAGVYFETLEKLKDVRADISKLTDEHVNSIRYRKLRI
jgi:hypothetical protein